MITVSRLEALGDSVLVADMPFGERFLASGLVLLNDDGKSSGIRPRWSKVYTVGPEHKDVAAGQWILVAHGRWTRGVKIHDGQAETIIRKVDPKDILLVSDEPPQDETVSQAI
jgi:hypothetical protein